jgi:hypothetical protein
VTALSLPAGGTADLSAALWTGRLPLTVADEQLSWSVTEGVGTVDASGLFTAGSEAGSGVLTVTAGKTVQTVDIAVLSSAPLLTLTLEEGLLPEEGSVPEEEPLPEEEPAPPAAMLRGSVTSQSGLIPSPQSLTVFYDGAPLPLTFDAATGAFSAPLPEADGLLHRVTAEIEDAAGRRSRASLDLAKTLETVSPFADVTGHWAASWLDYLYDHGVMTGAVSGEQLLARPDSGITRQELATMLWRAYGQGVALSDAPLPFADADQIAPWAQEAARGMAAMGIIQGVTGADGALRFAPTDTVTRAQAVTMLGRLVGEGFAVTPTNFADGDTIGDWALPHVEQMVSLGFLGGFDDATFRPAAPMTRAQVAKVLYLMG